MKNISSIVSRALDLHVHVGPEIIPRKYTSPDALVRDLRGKLAGVALKNHFFQTMMFAAQADSSDLAVVGSVTLNAFMGGMNPEAIIAASSIAKRPFIVWFPTVHAKQFLTQSAWEIAPEWVDKRTSFTARKAKDIDAVCVVNKNNALTADTIAVLRSIKSAGAILATGHISWRETRTVVRAAADMGIEKIIITHPIYQRIAMPIEIQQELVRLGAFAEQCWSMWKIDKIKIKNIARQIKKIGASGCILTSDSGQTFSPSPYRALSEFCLALRNEGISLNELETMCVTNPKKLISR